jgi:hypothetical protein
VQLVAARTGQLPMPMQPVLLAQVAVQARQVALAVATTAATVNTAAVVVVQQVQVPLTQAPVVAQSTVPVAVVVVAA